LDLHHSKTDDPKEVINNAINNTLSRTIITAFTVVLILVILFIFGGDVIKGFSFALLIGVIFGTYSSICVATPVIIDFGKKDLK
jgi:SecD/SecF fusion protein